MHQPVNNCTFIIFGFAFISEVFMCVAAGGRSCIGVH